MRKGQFRTQSPAGNCDTGEDPALTAFLTAQVAALLSGSHEPRPRCPRCDGDHITSAGFKTRQSGRLPMFECQTCRRYFGRTVDTPLSEKHLRKLDLFISLLSQPISCLEAGERMGSLPADIGKRVTAWRDWLLRLDPGGTWERRIRLGGRPTELEPAPLPFAEIGAREDTHLTARLKRAFDALNSTSRRPPPCPRCGSRKTHFSGESKGGIPGFQCGTCRRKFSRRSGTPFVNTKMSTFERMTEFIRYLALPLSIMQVSEIVGTSAAMVQKWRDKFAEFAEQLEPGGRLSSTIRLGVTPDGTTLCPFCGRAGTAQHADNRGWSCAGCGRLFSMRRRVVDRNGGLCILSDEASSAPGQPTTSGGIQL
jgi:transposase-like protein